MKKLLFVSVCIIAFFVWLFSIDYTISEENKAIKRIKETTGLHLFGLKRIYSAWRFEKTYNKKGQMIEWASFEGNLCKSRDIYEYNTANLQTKIRSFAGNQLLYPHKIEELLYDSLNRNTATLLYEINKMHPDTFLYEKTSYYYDSLNRKYKTTIEHFSSLYPDSEYTSTFIEYFNPLNLVLYRKYFSTNGDTSITNYYYDTQKNVIAESGGLLDDSIVYTRNSNGKILKEETFHQGILSSSEENWYDTSGNKIKTYADNENNNTYKYQYDSRNRLIKETRSSPFSIFFKGCVTYEYEFY